jgi:hypothetical protein
MSIATVRTWAVYPDVLPQRGRTVARDGVVLLCLIVLAWAGLRVHDDTAGLDRLGVGVAQAGSSVQRGFGAAADGVGGVPVVGGQLSQSLRSAGVDAGGVTARSARQADPGIGRAAILIGWLIFLLPAAVLLGRYLPGRVRHICQMTAAARVLIGSGDAAQRRLSAVRSRCPTGRCFATPDSRLPILPKVTTSRSSTRSSRTPASVAVRVNPTEQ